ncbi:MAG: BACON domain-containing protein, partial [Prevotellaceae bacterium]|nr:BACON domain-containing protein [Prevotellaceae bacterium]
GITAGTDNVTITTNMATWATSVIPTWLSLSDDTGGTGITTISVYPKANNTGTTPLTATITISAGGLTETFTVTQGINPTTIAGSGTPPTANTYVGAFWRATETGERILRFGIISGSNIGNWTASVVWTDANWAPGDIVLDTDQLDISSLAARGIDFSSVIPNGSISNAEDYKLSGFAQSVSGTVPSGGIITFRIGLKSNFTAYNEFTNPARYAVVLLSYNLNGTPKHQKIFIRQGEGADNVSTVSPYNDVKWSPYNVGNYDEPNQYGFNKIVDFPTKAGYFYQWGYGSSTTPRPIPPQDPQNAAFSVAAPHNYCLTDACPTGYTVPSGTTTGDVASLIPATATISSVYGYYADGYFDRRAIVASASNHANSTVSAGNNDVAYRGRLVFNSVTNASLFFPAGGNRIVDTGVLGPNLGRNGHYWTSTPSSSNTTAYGTSFRDNTDFDSETGSLARSNIRSVRCIKVMP